MDPTRNPWKADEQKESIVLCSFFRPGGAKEILWADEGHVPGDSSAPSGRRSRNTNVPRVARRRKRRRSTRGYNPPPRWGEQRQFPVHGVAPSGGFPIPACPPLHPAAVPRVCFRFPVPRPVPARRGSRLHSLAALREAAAALKNTRPPRRAAKLPTPESRIPIPGSPFPVGRSRRSIPRHAGGLFPVPGSRPRIPNPAVGFSPPIVSLALFGPCEVFHARKCFCKNATYVNRRL